MSSSRASSKRKRAPAAAQPSLLAFFDSPPKKIAIKEPQELEIIDVDLLDTVAPAPPSRPPRATPVALTNGAPHAANTYGDLSADPLLFHTAPCPWPSGTAAPYSFLAHTLATLAETRSRILILNTLTNALRTIAIHDSAALLPSLYLLSNTLSPSYSPIELGIGHSVISKAIQHVSGLTPAALRRLYVSTGDVGDVAFEAKSNLRTLIPHPPLRVRFVYDSLLQIARVKGNGAVKQKQVIVEKLLVAAKGEETRFLVRTLSQNIRVGAVRTSILTALSRAMALIPPSTQSFAVRLDSAYHIPVELLSRVAPMETRAKKTTDGIRDEISARFAQAESLVKKVFVQHPNYDHIVAALIEGGLDDLAVRVPLAVGIPLQPTLGSPTRSLQEIYERLGGLPFAAEFKYDGQRAQIHSMQDQNGTITTSIFSRHLEDMTTKYPDVVSLVKHMFVNSPQMTSFIMDSEIVAIDPVTGELKSFQELSNRARKDVQVQDVQVAVGVFAFDLMYLNGEILLEKPFRQRRTLLRTWFPPQPSQPGMAQLAHVESCESDSGQEQIEEFWERAVESQCEGLMIKLLDSGEILEQSSTKANNARKKPLPATYEPDKRTSAWLKLKKDYVTGLGDTLDVVPIGAWYGNGRKHKWWSPILLGLREVGSTRIVGICKCMSGFTDEFYKNLAERYQLTEDSDTCSRSPLWGCETGGFRPSVYFKPQEVWEIRGADVTLSPVSVAALGLVSDARGLSLRFPRFLRVREDKSIEQASTTEFLAQMWRSQQGKGRAQAGADDGELIDADVDDAGSLDSLSDG